MRIKYDLQLIDAEPEINQCVVVKKEFSRQPSYLSRIGFIKNRAQRSTDIHDVYETWYCVEFSNGDRQWMRRSQFDVVKNSFGEK